MSSLTQLNSQENSSLPTKPPAFISQLNNNSSIHPMPVSVKRNRDGVHSDSKNNCHFQQLTSDSYPESPPHTPSGSLSKESDEISTHVDLSEKMENLEQIEPQPKRRSSAKLKLSDFTLIRTLGTGSFGRVHLAQSMANHQFCAIKVLKKKDIMNSRQVEHVKSERSVLAKVKNDFMKLEEQTAKFYAAEVLLAICHLHEQNIIYRDLKPENILLDARGHIKLTDFGFAKSVPDITWTLCGTPDYLAPEIIQSKGYGKAVDYWALGVLIYEMLSGVAPFYDENQFRLYEKIITCKPVYPPHLSQEVVDLLRHLLTPDLSSRYGNLKAGSQDVIQHPWFKSIDFDGLVKRQVQAPYIPLVQNAGDASNFDHFEEEKVPYGQSQPDPYRKYFTEF
ncbi:hypothetical protein G6F45_000850 [Rhizopus arrhizus]|nr:hypothetical protein G6F45_000850 [Rhizopus arrhizus]